MNLKTDLNKLIENLPFFLKKKLEYHLYQDQLIEVILDLGCRPEGRFSYALHFYVWLYSNKTKNFMQYHPCLWIPSFFPI